MTTTTPETVDSAAGILTDPYAYGWRYVPHPQPDGTTLIEHVPLTLEDVLHPEEGDHVTHSRDHERFRKYIANVLEARVRADTGAAVLIDVRVAWDTPDLKPHGPDIMVVFGVREQKNWSTFDVAREGVRPALIVEITSPETRQLDLFNKVDEYELAGVPFYIIVETYIMRRVALRRLKGYRLEQDVFTVMAPDERGWLWLEPVRIWMGVRDNQIECYDAAGNLIGDYSDIEDARAAAEARADAAEARLHELEAELRQLRGAS